MSADSATPRYTFAMPAPLPLEAAFDGGRLTSDGGLPWLAEVEAALGVCAAFAAGVPEWRRGRVPLFRVVGLLFAVAVEGGAVRVWGKGDRLDCLKCRQRL